MHFKIKWRWVEYLMPAGNPSPTQKLWRRKTYLIHTCWFNNCFNYPYNFISLLVSFSHVS